MANLVKGPDGQMTLPDAMTSSTMPGLVGSESGAGNITPTAITKGDPKVYAQQVAVNKTRLASGLPAIKEDGIMGPQTRAALGTGTDTTRNFNSLTQTQTQQPQTPPQAQGSTPYARMMMAILQQAQGNAAQIGANYLDANGQLRTAKQKATNTGIKAASDVLNGQQYDPRNAVSMANQMESAYDPSILSASEQMQSLNDVYRTQSDIQKTAMTNAMSLLDKEETAKQNALDRAFQAQQLAEQIRSNKANEAIDAAKANTANGTITPQILSENLEQVAIMDSMLANPKLENISGATDQFIGGWFGEAATAKNQFKQLSGLLALASRGKLKGSGAISDYESKTLKESAMALGRNLPDAEFRKELVKLKGLVSANAGLPVFITLTDPRTGETSNEFQSNKIGIEKAVKEGLLVTYLE